MFSSIRSFALLAYTMLCGVVSLFAYSIESDTVKALPVVAIGRDMPISTFDFAHSFQFAIHDATPKQVEAWLAGDYPSLHGTFSEGTNSTGGKGEMFQNVAQALSEARQAIADVQRLGNYVSQFDGRSLIKLPVAIFNKVTNDGSQFTAVINRISLYPTHAELAVFLTLKTADMASPLYFGAPDIVFTRRGGIQVGSIGLLGNFDIPIMDKKGFLRFKGAVVQNNDFVTGVGTFAAFDCDGLQQLNLDISLAFSREVVVPVKDTLGMVIPIPDRLVTADLSVNASGGLNSIIATASVNTPFAHPDKMDVVWEIQNAIFDFSELDNDESLAFPVAGYTPDLPPAMLNNWKGVYIQSFSVRFPGELFGGGQDATASTTISGQDIIIDQSGFSGFVSIQPLLSLGDGNADGWAYSIDSLGLHINRNKLVGLGFEGLINIPLFNQGDDGTAEAGNALAYKADFNIVEQTYGFAVSGTEPRVYESKMLRASVTVNPESTLHMVYSAATGFEITATLHGTISIDAQMSSNTTNANSGLQLSVPEVTFQHFTIGNKSPYIHNAGTWGADTISVDLGGFGMTLSNIGMVSYQDEPGRVDIQFMGEINLGTSSTTVSAGGGFRIQGEVEVLPNGRQNWKYKKFKVDELFIDFENPSVEFYGHVIFFDDLPTFGKGFQGRMELRVKNPEITAEAMGLFGTAPGGFRYFFVDVMVGIPAGVVSISGIDIRAIGGGVYVNMKQQEVKQNFSNAPSGDVLPVYQPNSGNLSAYEQAIIAKLGESLSGTRYLPDTSVWLGLNFAVVIATATDESVFNASMMLNFEFARSVNGAGGGLQRVRLAGYASMMDTISWSAPSCKGISIKFMMEYTGPGVSDTGTAKFTASADVFVNLGLIRGGNPSPSGADTDFDSLYADGDNPCDQGELRYAGGMDMLFTKDNWHILVGVSSRVPTPRPAPGMPISLDVGLSLGDEEVAGLVIKTESYFNIGTQIPPFPGLPSEVAQLTGLGNLVQNEAARATGRGFAFGMNIKVNSSANLIGIVSASLNLDVGFDIMLQRYQEAICVNNNDRPLGINGWYAAGQAWAFVKGTVSVLGFNVLNAALAAAIQVKGPNPMYGRGAIAGRYSVLGGLKKGTFRMPLQFGFECQLEGGGAPAMAYELIGGITPIDGAEGTPTDSKPAIDFNYPVGQVVELEEGEGTVRYKVVLEQAEMRKATGQIVAGTWVWSEDKYSVSFLPHEMLQANTEYTLSAVATLHEVNSTGQIQGAAIDTDERTVAFKTDDALQYIPLSNIQSAWPANGQFNYYQGENVPNHIALKSGQDYLFEGNSTVKLFVYNGTDVIELPVTYDTVANSIEYVLPELDFGGAYRASLVRRNVSGGGTDSYGSGVFATPSTSQQVQADDVQLLMFFFRVSRYGTFSSKITQMSVAPLSAAPRYDHGGITGLVEPFGYEELVGLDGLPDNVLDLTILLGSTPWMNPNRMSMYNVPCNFSVSALDYQLWELTRNAINPVPDNAVTLIQDNINSFLVKEDNYLNLHQNRDNNLFQQYGVNLEIRYYLRTVVAADFRALTDLAGGSGADYDLFSTVATDCADGGLGGADMLSQTFSNIQAQYNNDVCFNHFYSFTPTSFSDMCPPPPDPNQYPAPPPPAAPFQRRILNTDPNSSFDYPIQLRYKLPTGVIVNQQKNLRY